MSLPNFITLGRIILVPLVIAMIVARNWQWAFALFVIAGVSDAVDGFIAKRFNMTTELGAFIDPLADKALLVSLYVSLAVVDVLPAWLAILVVFRDVIILGAVIVAWIMDRPLEIRPLKVSKLNTVAQIAFAACVLGTRAFQLPQGPLIDGGVLVVAALTLASGAAYFAVWTRHMAE
ncbi:CDP-alcohol phosphatidyltransferase family protein [Terrarubrum flagellatum]|uniref:CDP-alcohol phosphatidyltransferase family protein n=1 Tax=Terrirubrum flagellatum TaxID=2895980 RepID=UPI003144D7A8